MHLIVKEFTFLRFEYYVLVFNSCLDSVRDCVFCNKLRYQTVVKFQSHYNIGTSCVKILEQYIGRHTIPRINWSILRVVLSCISELRFGAMPHIIWFSENIWFYDLVSQPRTVDDGCSDSLSRRHYYSIRFCTLGSNLFGVIIVVEAKRLIKQKLFVVFGASRNNLKRTFVESEIIYRN